MINLYDYKIFSKNSSSLKKTSKNDADKKSIVYMTSSKINVIDFDGVKNDYIANLKLSDTPKSNDALFAGKAELFFIEFKNGNMKNELYKVKRKIFDSLLIFTDIVCKGVSYTRQKVNYILVYNKENSKEYIESLRNKLEKDEVHDARNYDKIMNSLSQFANIELDIFGLRNQFEKLYFKEVYTYTEQEFEEKFVKQYETNI